MEAAHSGRLDRLSWLLKRSLVGGKSIGVNTINFEGRNSLFFALQSGHLECTELLIVRGACTSGIVSTLQPYKLIFKPDSVFAVRITKHLMRSKKMLASISARQGMLLEAIKRGHVECVQIMLATGLQYKLKLQLQDADDHDLVAKRKRNEATRKLDMNTLESRKLDLLDRWHDVIRAKTAFEGNKEVILNDPLHKCYAAMLQVLFIAGASIPSDWRSATCLIEYAFMVSDVEAVRFLLAKDPASRRYATRAKHRNAVLRQVYNGIDREKSYVITKLLINARAQVYVPYAFHQPLHYAIAAMSPECVRTLIAKKAFIAKDSYSYFMVFNESHIELKPVNVVEENVVDVLRQLLEICKALRLRPNVSDLYFPFKFMCKHGFTSGLLVLLDHDAGDNRELNWIELLYPDREVPVKDEIAANIVRLLASLNIPTERRLDFGIEFFKRAFNCNHFRTIAALIDAGTVFCRSEDTRSVIIALLCIHLLEDTVNGPIAQNTAFSISASLKSSGIECARSMIPLFVEQPLVPIKSIVETFYRVLEETQEKAPMHIMLLRLFIDEFRGCMTHHEVIFKAFKNINGLAIVPLLLDLAGPHLLTPESLEFFVLHSFSSPCEVLTTVIFPALTLPLEDAVTDACFLHICKRGFSKSLEAILAATGADVHARWALLEPLKICCMDMFYLPLQSLQVLLRYKFGASHSFIVSALRCVYESGHVSCFPPMLRALRCSLSTIPECHNLVYEIYEKCARSEYLSAKMLEILLCNGLDANVVCDDERGEKNALIVTSAACNTAAVDMLLSARTRPVDETILNEALAACLANCNSSNWVNINGNNEFDPLGTLSLLRAAGGNLENAMSKIEFNELGSYKLCLAMIILGSKNIATKKKIIRWAEISLDIHSLPLAFYLMAQLGTWSEVLPKNKW